MAPLNSRPCSRSCRLRLSTETAPTSAAPTRPTSTTAARLAAELGDQADWRAAIGVGVESQIRKSNCRMTRSVQYPRGTCGSRVTATSAAAARTTSAV